MKGDHIIRLGLGLLSGSAADFSKIRLFHALTARWTRPAVLRALGPHREQLQEVTPALLAAVGSAPFLQQGLHPRELSVGMLQSGAQGVEQRRFTLVVALFGIGPQLHQETNGTASDWLFAAAHISDVNPESLAVLRSAPKRTREIKANIMLASDAANTMALSASGVDGPPFQDMRSKAHSCSPFFTARSQADRSPTRTVGSAPHRSSVATML